MEAQSTVHQPVSDPAEATADFRRRLHSMWAGVAESWSEHADYADARGAVVAEQMLEVTHPAPGERVLELACGPGGAGVAAAQLVGPGGEVVMTDVVPEMTAIGAARANALGLTNVRTRELDLDNIDEPDQSYDVVLCREGLMFATDPTRATRDMRRVLRPGGRVAVAVWGPREKNPWLGLVLDAVSAELGVPMPPPGIPGPFSLGDSDQLRDLLGATELDDVSVRELPVPLRADSFDEWWTRTTALAGPVAQLIAGLPDDAAALRSRLHDTVRSYETPTGLVLPGVSLVASGRRP
jgi:enediyne biosynthesis protein CalE5